MAPDGYLREILGRGARPFRHRGGVRELLGVPGDGTRVAFPAAPRGGFVYRRSTDGALRAQAAEGAWWQAQVTGDPADPWRGEPAPPAGETAADAGADGPWTAAPDKSARPGPRAASSPGPVATCRPGDRGLLPPVPVPWTGPETAPGPTRRAGLPTVTIPGITLTGRRAPVPDAPAPVRDVPPDPPRPGPSAGSDSTRSGAGPPLPQPAQLTTGPPAPARRASPEPAPPAIRSARPGTTIPGVTQSARHQHVAPPDAWAATRGVPSDPLRTAPPAPGQARPAPVPGPIAGPAAAQVGGADPARRNPPRAGPAAGEPRPTAMPPAISPRRGPAPRSAPPEGAFTTQPGDAPRRPPASRPAAAGAPDAPPPTVIVPPSRVRPAAFWERRHVGRLRARIPR